MEQPRHCVQSVTLTALTGVLLTGVSMDSHVTYSNPLNHSAVYQGKGLVRFWTHVNDLAVHAVAAHEHNSWTDGCSDATMNG